MIRGEEITTNELLKLAQNYNDKSFVVSVGTSSSDDDHDPVKFIEVAKLYTNVKLNVRCSIFDSLQSIEPWKRKFSKYFLLFEDPQTSFRLLTSVSIYCDKRRSEELLAAQLYKIGYDKINEFHLLGGSLEDVEEFEIGLGIIGKMANLEKLTIDGELTVNKDTIWDLSGLHKLRRLSITCDGYSNEWLSTCLPESIEQLTLFKNMKRRPQYHFRLGKTVGYHVFMHDNNGVVYNLNSREHIKKVIHMVAA